MRVISDNAADRASVVASSQAGSTMGVDKLFIDKKSNVWRSAAGTVAKLSASWSTAELIGGAALAFCNLSPTALMRVRITNETSATNLIRGSETLSASNGWSGGTAAASASLYNSVVPFVQIAKATSSANEARTCSFAAVSNGDVRTLTVALRAGTVTSMGVGIYDSSNSSWGANGSSTAQIVEGPGVLAQVSGGHFNVTGLSTTQDTLVKVTRTFSAASAVPSIMLYPGSATSTTSGASALATRLQLEAGSAYSSYYPTTNSAATRPVGYIDSWQSYDNDTGFVLCCPDAGVKLRGWTAAQAASAYNNGGGSIARAWFAEQKPALAMVVDIQDVNNLQGYIEAARLVAGPYWESTYQPSVVEQSVTDNTKIERFGGDQLCDVGSISNSVKVSLTNMPQADKVKFMELARNSKSYPVLLSVFPGLAEDIVIYGRRSKDSAAVLSFGFNYTTNIEIDSI